MMSDATAGKWIILNGSMDMGQELVAALESHSYKGDVCYPGNLQQFEKHLINDDFELIIVMDIADPLVSCEQALAFRLSSPCYQNIPCIVLAPEASSSTRMKWMTSGASDVVEQNNYELLSMVVGRETGRREAIQDEKPSANAGAINRALEECVKSTTVCTDKTLFMMELKDWITLSSGLSDDDKGAIHQAIEKAVQAEFTGEVIYEQLSDNQVAVVADVAESNAAQQAKAVTRCFDQLFIDLDSQSLQTGIALAVVPLKYKATSVEELFSRSAGLLKEAQSDGVNKFRVFCPDSELEKQATEGDAYALVQHALDNKAFKLMFQPIASLRGDEQEHYDVLLRILNPEGKEISAGQFMGEIDKTPLAEKLDKWVILQSIKKLQARSEKQATAHLFLHLSGATLQDKKFLPWLFLLLKKATIKPDNLVFQVAEENIVRFQDKTESLFKGLEKIGCRTSVCHFGSTMNPMRIARDFATDYIKLAGKWTQDMAGNPDLEQPVHEMIEQLQNLGRKTIVPQIESPNVMTRVWRTGSDYVQGYFLQKPKPDMDYDFSSDGE